MKHTAADRMGKQNGFLAQGGRERFESGRAFERVSPVLALSICLVLSQGGFRVAEAAASKAGKNSTKATPVTSTPIAVEPIGEPNVPAADKGGTPASKKAGAGKAAASKAEGTNLTFIYTHLLPSPINLPQGAWKLGTNPAYGVVDFVEFSTDIARDVTRHFNVMAKVPLIEFPTFVASAFIQYGHFNLRHFDHSNPDYAISAWQPGLVTGYEIQDDMAFFLGGNLHVTDDKIPQGASTSGYAYGARANVDWSWMYNPVGGRLSENTLSVGGTYDFTEKVVGFGVTHHWATFEIGVHFYPNADNYKMMPILNISSGF